MQVENLVLVRNEEIVADAVVFPDGMCVLHWRTDPPGTEIYPSKSAMHQIRHASGRSVFKAL
jgi:hypothetical protein